jgi:hypothetical protein
MEIQFFFNLQSNKDEPTYYNTLEGYMVDNDQSQYGRNLLVLCILVEVGPRNEKVGKESSEILNKFPYYYCSSY